MLICNGCGCEEALDLPVVLGPGGIALCLVCVGELQIAMDSVMRERDDREIAQQQEERDRVKSH